VYSYSLALVGAQTDFSSVRGGRLAAKATPEPKHRPPQFCGVVPTMALHIPQHTVRRAQLDLLKKSSSIAHSAASITSIAPADVQERKLHIELPLRSFIDDGKWPGR
jgi:hypothetical protein